MRKETTTVLVTCDRCGSDCQDSWRNGKLSMHGWEHTGFPVAYQFKADMDLCDVCFQDIRSVIKPFADRGQVKEDDH